MTLIKRLPALSFFIAAMLLTYVLGIAAYLVIRRLETALGLGDNIWLNNFLLRFGPALAGIGMVAITSFLSGRAQ
jgi:hypothetical protein